MRFMKRKILCPKINNEVFLTFDIIKAATMDKPHYSIGLISSCSACNEVCKECPLAKVLCNQPIDL